MKRAKTGHISESLLNVKDLVHQNMYQSKTYHLDLLVRWRSKIKMILELKADLKIDHQYNILTQYMILKQDLKWNMDRLLKKNGFLMIWYVKLMICLIHRHMMFHQIMGMCQLKITKMKWGWFRKSMDVVWIKRILIYLFWNHRIELKEDWF